MKFRVLTKDEIDVRVQSVKENGVVLLLYKNARCDMNILDETVGAENWQRKHYECKGNLFCSVGINVKYADADAVPVFVFKDDCGTESNTEKEKGEASDSFKRACFNWGIGRELYTSPFIWISADNVNIKNGKTRDQFAVEKIKTTNGKITGLAIINTTKKSRCFVYNEVTKNV